MTAVVGRVVSADALLLDRLRERLAAEARKVARNDLVRLLADLPAVDDPRPLRVLVAGETKRGKSTLLNTLVGRPLLSPVGVDVTTTCWVEVAHGQRDEAEVVLANPAAPGEPTRRRCALEDVRRYAAPAGLADSVVGVQVRLRAPILRNLTIVDTPGVGGLEAGHARTTLAALRTADALLFVCDSRQPVSAPELDFLVEAARRVPTVVVAVTKCDVNPRFDDVVEATRQVVEGTPGLGAAPVLPVAAPLADRATEVHDERRAQRMRQISGIERLMDALHRHGTAATAAVRLENAALVLAEVCRTLLARSDEIVEILDGNTSREERLRRDIAAMRDALDEAPRFGALVERSLAHLHAEPAAAFDARVEQLRSRYCAVAASGSAAQLADLESRYLGEVAAAAVAAIEQTARDAAGIVADLVQRLGGADRWPVTSTTAPAAFSIGLQPPDGPTGGGGTDLVASAELFTALVEVLAGSVVVVSVLTGPGIIAAGIALAAGASWLTSRAGDQERRTRLTEWVDQVATEACATFRIEVGNRVRDAERRVAAELPALIAGRRHELSRLSDELDGIRSTGRDLRTELAQRRRAAEGLRDVEREAAALAARARAVRGA
ncbi:dynamin family protein [Pseudonocardia lacus]|uniref:dynamin family protein n=1 Tax=Pseudonocardia lacus TaxID=2835865 RepID=UPI001BDCDCDB|nr:dynamin family protein [Pseudonocardia lacus]